MLRKTLGSLLQHKNRNISYAGTRQCWTTLAWNHLILMGIKSDCICTFLFWVTIGNTILHVAVYLGQVVDNAEEDVGVSSLLKSLLQRGQHVHHLVLLIQWVAWQQPQGKQHHWIITEDRLVLVKELFQTLETTSWKHHQSRGTATGETTPLNHHQRQPQGKQPHWIITKDSHRGNNTTESSPKTATGETTSLNHYQRQPQGKQHHWIITKDSHRGNNLTESTPKTAWSLSKRSSKYWKQHHWIIAKAMEQPHVKQHHWIIKKTRLVLVKGNFHNTGNNITESPWKACWSFSKRSSKPKPNTYQWKQHHWITMKARMVLIKEIFRTLQTSVNHHPCQTGPYQRDFPNPNLTNSSLCLTSWENSYVCQL